MLHVGVVDGPGAADVVGRLEELGAVVDPASDEAVEAAVVVQLGRGPGLHLLVGVGDVEADVDVLLDAGDLRPAVDELWTARLVPFEANLRTGRRAPRRGTAVLFDPDPTWAAQAQRLIGRLDEAVGDLVVRIDHIGSTSVPGLPAKDLLDIQVVVDDLAVARQVAERARAAGFVHVRGEWFGTDRHGTDHPEEVVVDADPCRPTNVNIRPVTASVWRETLLFRDWLRTHPTDRDAYATLKRTLSDQTPDVDTYSTRKLPFISAAVARASEAGIY